MQRKRELQIQPDTLQRDLTRKDRALAETAAWPVLQKKELKQK